jgi:hypothetical protein
VFRNAQRFDPRFVVNTNPDATNGPPQVTDDNRVLGGNSRTMSMQMIYDKGGEKAEQLRSYLKEQAHQFGFTAEDVDAIKNPILVRTMDPPDGEKHTKQEMALRVRQLNESFTQAMDPRTMQVAMARKVSDGTMAALTRDMKSDETLSGFLGSSRAQAFINSLSKDGVIDARNANAYLRKNTGRTKQLNQDGKTLVERILVGRLVGDADLMADMRPSTVAAVARAVPTLLTAASKGKGFDISGSLRTAVDALNTTQNKGDKAMFAGTGQDTKDSEIDRELSTFDADLFGDAHPVATDPKAKMLYRALVKRPGPVQFSKLARAYADAVEAEGQEDQAVLTGTGRSKRTAEDVLRAVVEDQIPRAKAKEEPEKDERQALEDAGQASMF